MILPPETGSTYGLPVGVERGDAGAAVVHQLGVAGAELDPLDPAVLGELLFGQHHLERGLHVLDLVGHPVGLRQVDDEVGLTHRPSRARREGVRRRRGGAIARLGAGLGPGHQGGDLSVAQDPLALEDAVELGRRVPGRHLARLRHLGDRLRPRPRLVVGLERHRRDHPGVGVAGGTVAVLAVLLQDREDVAIEGRRRARGRVVRCGGMDRRRARDCNQHHRHRDDTHWDHRLLLGG